ncbi:aldo/keto reductase [Sphingobacterium pedocola]|uniref:Alcohol dehydrogenase n=1 Tax=Sphingobacterium pedocola TaxID=2082722 RepID=A0ABR9TB75_9SPHI|nr:aldo/keto reductase [Sphingobacterium pedocola]MBE8722530.1 alcohol dehydrogenase [Sphingobacterium pedocola]
MVKRKIGKSNLSVAPIIFGGNVFGWTLDEKQAFDILDEFVDLGFNGIDTANQYSYWVPGNLGGESETIIGNWLSSRGNRDKIIVMTKVGGTSSDIPEPINTKEHIFQQVERSLRRLKTDYVDLYQTHFDSEKTPVEETLRAYEDLIKVGKVRSIGASNVSPQRLKESLYVSEGLKIARYQSLQPLYNLFDREKFEQNYQQIAQNFELSVIPYYSLASGFLTGKYQTENDFTKSDRGEGVKQKYWSERGERIIKALAHVAAENNTSPAAIALAWLLAQSTVTAPIVSATKAIHLGPFITAVELNLSHESLTLLNEASKY